MIHSVWSQSLNFTQDMRGHHISWQRAGHIGSEWPHVISFHVSIKKPQKKLMFHFRCLNEPISFLLWSDLWSWLSLFPSFPLDRKAENVRAAANVSAVCSLPCFILFSTAPPSADSARFLLKQIYSVMCPSCVWEATHKSGLVFLQGRTVLKDARRPLFFHFSSALSFVFALCKWTWHTRWNVSSVKKFFGKGRALQKLEGV